MLINFQFFFLLMSLKCDNRIFVTVGFQHWKYSLNMDTQKRSWLYIHLSHLSLAPKGRVKRGKGIG